MEAAVRILLVEDEKKVAKALQEGLEHEGYSIRVGHTGEDGFYLISSEPFDLIILDVMLPGRSGLEILRTARANGLRTPVLILTALDAVEDRVVGLNSGADDYLVKPFAFPQLQARLRALLRTPLTAIRSIGEVGLQSDGAAPYYRGIIGSMLEEANRLTRLIDGLLTISRADTGQIKLSRTAISVFGVAREAATLLEVLAEEKNQKVHVTGNPELMVLADRTFLRQAVVNLLDNAIKYSPVNVVINTRIFQADDQAVLDVEDHGPGITPEQQAHIFERFYRVDQARSNEAGGAGLGLWIAKWAVEANGGVIELRSEGGRGCVFRTSLPLAGAYRPGNALASV